MISAMEEYLWRLFKRVAVIILILITVTHGNCKSSWHFLTCSGNWSTVIKYQCLWVKRLSRKRDRLNRPFSVFLNCKNIQKFPIITFFCVSINCQSKSKVMNILPQFMSVPSLTIFLGCHTWTDCTCKN